MTREVNPIPPQFAVGKQVYVRGHHISGPRTIVRHYANIDGGVRLDQPVPANDIFVSWNIEELVPWED